MSCHPDPTHLARLRTRLRRFVGDERGSMIVFALFIFILVIMVGGLAVDVMRYEERRVNLQNTADRAVLAAGSLTQTGDPEAVVRDYFEREGLQDYLTGVTVNEGLNFREVTVQTASAMPTFFMRMIGIDTLPMSPAATAEERYSKVEVSLVLDLSNSMNSFSRIENLRDAGGEFIETLFDNSEPGQVSVSVVNYTGQVNPGAELADFYTITHTHPFSHCVEFGADDYTTMALSTVDALVGAGHFDPWHNSRARNMIFCPSARLPQFSTTDNTNRDNIVFSGDPDFLTTYLTELWADGNTSIEIGLKWGAALLDPGSRPIIDTMIAEGLVDSAFDGRPLDFDDEEALKVVVLMTDGENFVQFMMRDQYKTGQSDIWHTVFFNTVPAQGGLISLEAEVDGILNGTIVPTELQRHRFNALSVPMDDLTGLNATRPNRTPSSGAFNSANRVYLSVRPNNSGNWYLPSPTAEFPTNSGNWRNTPWTGNNLPNNVSAASGCTFHGANTTGLAFDFIRCNDRIAYRMTYPWLWDNFPVTWVANHMYGWPGIMNATTFRNSVLFQRSANVKNQHLSTMCQTIRDNNVLIYAVAFEAPDGGVQAMQDCATSLAHFFDVEGTDISTVFRAIAGSINRLRLTQ